MGFRTVVIFDNDYSEEWGDNSDLGAKILVSIKDATKDTNVRVVEHIKSDVQTLAIIDGLFMHPICYGRIDSKLNDVKIGLLRKAAKELGYNLLKIKK